MPPNNSGGVILITILALVLIFLTIYFLSKKKSWTSKKQGFFIGSLICLILTMGIILGMFSYSGSCTKFLDHSYCGQFTALVYPFNLIFALFFGIIAFFIGGLIGWIIGKTKSQKSVPN